MSTARSSSFSNLQDSAPRPREEEVEDGSRKELMWSLMDSYLSPDVHTIQRSIVNHVEYTLASTRMDFDTEKAYRATAHRL